MSLGSNDVWRLEQILETNRSKATNLTRPQPTKSRERICEECNARITRTHTLGEVGHQMDCPRREKAYRGQRGRR